jgi:hypothetical protein
MRILRFSVVAFLLSGLRVCAGSGPEFPAFRSFDEMARAAARHASHWAWRDPEHAVIWADGASRLYKDDGSGEPEEALWTAPNGHRSFVPGTDKGWLVADACPQGEKRELSTLMPRREDYAYMWWAEGFPGHTPAAPWLRIVQTGRYALALDTATLQIAHFGEVPAGIGYAEAARADNSAWQRLPPAELTLSISVSGKVFRCTEGGRWSQFKGPRHIESGRFLQRADVTDLVFTADDGSRLIVDARFETVAWPDRLALILAARPGEAWTQAGLEIRLVAGKRELRNRWEVPAAQTWDGSQTREVFLALEPAAGAAEARPAAVDVKAEELPAGKPRPIDYDSARGWYRVNLDGMDPIVPPGGPERQNDAIERVRLVLSNPTAGEQTARLLFEKTAYGIRQRIGAAITGMSAVLRDAEGNPTGIPVQLSKNWHNRSEGGVYAGQWFHGVSQVRLLPRATVELELTIAYGHWGGVAAASHAQLCLIGWGSNQLWDESALGSWGESICYEPDQPQASAAILDVRPAMVKSMKSGRRWIWTHNVGGGDYFRLFDTGGQRVFPARMRTCYEKQGPCLTEVTYAGRTGDGLEHAATVSLARTDDIVRGTYRLRLDVTKATEFSRFVIFQIGADTYSYTGERKMALGDETGLLREWSTKWGGDVYRTEPMACTGRVPWVSLHQAVRRAIEDDQGAWANRGLVIRAWKARLGGKPAVPWVAERGVRAGGADTSTIDVTPPPGVTRLEPGDFVDAVFEHLVVPQSAGDYYGPNEGLRAALAEDGDTWRMIRREATGNDRRVAARTGCLERLYPDVRIRAERDAAEFTLAGGLGYVPVTFTGLTSVRGYTLLMDGEPVDQGVHGNDYWQTDHDPGQQRWSRTYNLSVGSNNTHIIRIKRTASSS